MEIKDVRSLLTAIHLYKEGTSPGRAWLAGEVWSMRFAPYNYGLWRARHRGARTDHASQLQRSLPSSAWPAIEIGSRKQGGTRHRAVAPHQSFGGSRQQISQVEGSQQLDREEGA